MKKHKLPLIYSFLLIVFVLGLASLGCGMGDIVLGQTPEPIPTTGLEQNGDVDLSDISLNEAGYPELILNFTAENWNDLYEKVEISLTIDKFYSNPFDPDLVKIDGIFISPSDVELIQPGFFDGDNTWKVRFTPKEIGTYSYQILLTEEQVTYILETGTFSVNDAADAGFLRVSSVNSRYFEFENGQQFFGVGMNVSWQGQGPEMVSNYEDIFYNMDAWGMNVARVWMINSIKAPYDEWIMSLQNQSLGNEYDLANAKDFDEVISLAEEYGIYLDLTIDDVVQFDSGHWETQNLYNVINGGVLDDPCEIFSDEQAKKAYKQLLRYIIARWGYSTSIFSWELFNEVDEFRWQCNEDNWIDVTEQEMVDWHAEMADYISSIDAHDHLVNTSTGSFKVHPYLYGDLAQMSYAQMHFYYWENWPWYPSDPECRDMADCIRYYGYITSRSVENKPAVIGEYGINGDPGYIRSALPILIHNSVWAGIMTGMAHTPWNWHWNEFINEPQAWETVVGISNYLSDGIVTVNLEPMRPINIDEYICCHSPEKAFNAPDYPDLREYEFEETNDNIRVMGLRSETDAIYLWVQNIENTWYNHINQVSISPQSGTISILNVQPNGAYEIETWDTYTGIIQNIDYVISDGTGRLSFDIAGLLTDMAYKIQKKNIHIYLPFVVKGQNS